MIDAYRDLFARLEGEKAVPGDGVAVVEEDAAVKVYEAHWVRDIAAPLEDAAVIPQHPDLVAVDDSDIVSYKGNHGLHINKIRILGVLGKAWSGNVYFDGLHFEADNLERSATDSSSPMEGDRVFIYKDAKISDPAKLQDLASGLLQMMKAAADRIMLPVMGAPDLQRGRKVTATSSSFGLSGAYVIAEAEHILSRSVGYLTTILLDRGRYALPADLKRTLERELRLEKLGTVKIT